MSLTTSSPDRDLLLRGLQQRIPGARLQRYTVASAQIELLQDDFPRTPLDPQVAAACWEHPPYWAFVWPGGGFLSDWLPQQRPQGKVVDLGCGSGALSICLAQQGCQVWAVDSDPEARLACKMNSQLNAVEFPICASLEEVGACDLLILADFLYDPANLSGIELLCKQSKGVLLADCRLQVPPPGFAVLPGARRRILPDLDWGDEFDKVFLAKWGGAVEGQINGCNSGP